MNPFLAGIAGMFLNKKRVIGWISAVALAIGAAFAGMQTQEFKDAVCSASVIDQPLKPVETAK